MATARDLLEAALELTPDERQRLGRELLASVAEDDVEADDELRAEVVRRALDVRDGRAVLLDGPSTLQDIRDRLQTR